VVTWREVDLKDSRSIVNLYAQGIEIIIPARKSLFVNFFLILWLLAWAYGEVVIINRLLINDNQTPDAFIVIFACGWTLSGMLASFIWLWNAMGREIIRIDDHELKLSREYVWFARSKFYETKYMRNLRISDLSPSSLAMGGGMEYWGLSGGTITFDYGPTPTKIGLGLDETEAERIIEAIKTRHKDF